LSTGTSDSARAAALLPPVRKLVIYGGRSEPPRPPAMDSNDQDPEIVTRPGVYAARRLNRRTSDTSVNEP
jgi:hypothetical protein